jgi:hypothetical protein
MAISPKVAEDTKSTADRCACGTLWTEHGSVPRHEPPERTAHRERDRWYSGRSGLPVVTAIAPGATRTSGVHVDY